MCQDHTSPLTRYKEPTALDNTILTVVSLYKMSDTGDNVPDELEEELDDLAETLRDPNRGDRTIEDQGEEGSIDGENEPGDNAADRGE